MDSIKGKKFFSSESTRGKAGQLLGNVVESHNERLSDSQRVLLSCEIEGHRARKQKIARSEEKLSILLRDVRQKFTSELARQSSLTQREYSLLVEEFISDTEFLMLDDRVNTETVVSYASESKYIRDVICAIAQNRRPSRSQRSGEMISVKSAVGMVGVDYCRRLIPLLILYSRLRAKGQTADDKTMKAGWNYSKRKALLAQHGVSDQGEKLSTQALLVSLISDIQWFKLAADVGRAFEKVMQSEYESYRYKNDAETYNMLHDIRSVDLIPQDYYRKCRESWNLFMLGEIKMNSSADKALEEILFPKGEYNLLSAEVTKAEIKSLLEQSTEKEKLEIKSLHPEIYITIGFVA